MALSGWLGPTAALTIVPYGLFMPLSCGPSYSSYLLVSYLSHRSVLLPLLCAPQLSHPGSSAPEEAAENSCSVSATGRVPR